MTLNMLQIKESMKTPAAHLNSEHSLLLRSVPPSRISSYPGNLSLDFLGMVQNGSCTVQVRDQQEYNNITKHELTLQ